VGVCILPCFFLEECAKFLKSGDLSKGFHDYLLSSFKKNTCKILRGRYYGFKNINSLAEDFFHDFYEKLKILCKNLLERADEIISIDAYVNQSIANFLARKIESFVKKEEKTLSVNQKVDKSGEDEAEFIEVIEYEEGDPFAEVIAEDVFESFLKECEKKKADIERHICFFASQELSMEDKFSNPSWSNTNKYKIRERTKKFIREFAEKFSVEEKVMGLVLVKFMSEICEKMNLYN
jgi:hypothetical protein